MDFAKENYARVQIAVRRVNAAFLAIASIGANGSFPSNLRRPQKSIR